MALQSTGPISFSQIQAEFGGSNPVSLSEYYRGGPNVADDPFVYQGIDSDIPASGAVRLGNFRGTTKGNTFVNYTTAGSTAFTVPANVRRIQLFAVGGGGGGANGGNNVGTGGSGGGGGGYSSATVSVASGNSVSISVGGGGGTGPMIGPGNFWGYGLAGGSSSASYLSSQIIVAGAGQGGTHNYGGPANSAQGGAGGSGSVSNGSQGGNYAARNGGAAGAGHPLGGSYGVGGKGGIYAGGYTSGTRGYVRVRY